MSPVSHSRRAHGEGTIYRTADGRLRGALRVTDPRTGKKFQRYVTGRTKTEVARRLQALRDDASSGNLARETTREYLTRWLESGKGSVRPSSWRQREQYVRCYIIPAIGSIPLAKLAPSDVERMTSNMVAAGKSSTTAAGARAILRRALSDAVRADDGQLARNVAKLALPPKRKTRSMERGRDYLDPGQLRTLLAACEDHPLGPAVTVAATTGLRQGELLGLRWQDVDIDAGTLRVQGALARSEDGGWELAEPKTERSRRTLNLPAAGRDALRRQRESQGTIRAEADTAWQDRDGLVFTDALGRALKGYNVTREFGGVLKAAGLPHVPFRALRHSVATALLAAGVPLRVVADVLGHSTITITGNIYAAVVPELRRDAADAMDRALS